MNRGCTGGGPVGPPMPERTDEAIEQAKAVTLDNHESDRDQNGNDYPYCNRKRDRQIRPQMDEQNKPKRGVGELCEKFESEVDDRTCRSDETRYSR